MNDDRTNDRTEMPEHGVPVDDLVRRAQNGDAAASETIFAEHWGICLRVARRMTGSDTDAEDVVQEAYVKAIMNLQRFDHRCAFRTWLLRIVTNAATDHIRRRRRKTMLLDFSSWFSGGSLENAEPSRSEDPSLPLQNAELRVRLDQALGELSQTTRGAFVLYAEAGMTYQEVSEALEIPLGTVMSRIHSARKKLRSIIDPLDDETPAGGPRQVQVVPETLVTNDPIRHILPNTGKGPLSHNLTW